MWWRIKFWIRFVLSQLSVGSYLSMRCSDWDMSFRDWPRMSFIGARCKTYPPGKYPPIFHYHCRAIHFFSSGTGVGRTAREAARRAVRNMDNKIRRQRLENPEDSAVMKALLTAI